jgi:RISC-loading complex subunit TARBP2
LTNFRPNFSGIGVGKNKKEAKHAAAKALIEKLRELNIFVEQRKTVTANDSSGAITGTSSTEKNLIENHIGVLQEFCVRKHLALPTYEVEVVVGMPHERQFTMACLVLEHREIGTGTTKKLANKEAARKMWERLQKPVDQTEIVRSCIDDVNDKVTEKIPEVVANDEVTKKVPEEVANDSGVDNEVNSNDDKEVET